MGLNYEKIIEICDANIKHLETNDFTGFFKANTIDKTMNQQLIQFFKDDLKLDPVKSLIICPDYMYYNYKDLSTPLVLNNIIEISNYAFSGSNCKKITAPDLQILGENAFSNSDLTILDLSKSTIKNIGKNAFVNCKATKQIILPATLEMFNPADFVGINDGVEIYIPDEVGDSLHFIGVKTDDDNNFDINTDIGKWCEEKISWY